MDSPGAGWLCASYIMVPPEKIHTFVVQVAARLRDQALLGRISGMVSWGQS